MSRELACNLVNHFSDGRRRAAKVQAVYLIQGGAPWRRDEGDYASINWYVKFLEEPDVVAMHKFHLPPHHREVAPREIEDMLIGFEANAF